MDMKEKIENVAKTLMSDPTLMESFQKDPKAAVKKVLGVVLTDDVVDAIVQGVKAKIGAEKVENALGGLGKLFGK